MLVNALGQDGGATATYPMHDPLGVIHVDMHYET